MGNPAVRQIRAWVIVNFNVKFKIPHSLNFYISVRSSIRVCVTTEH